MLKFLLRSSFAVVLLTAIYCGADHFAEPGKVHRVYYEDGTLSIECPLDSEGRSHGDQKTYHPSGRLKSIIPLYHGQAAGKPSYVDDVPDWQIEAEESGREIPAYWRKDKN